MSGASGDPWRQMFNIANPPKYSTTTKPKPKPPAKPPATSPDKNQEADKVAQEAAKKREEVTKVILTSPLGAEDPTVSKPILGGYKPKSLTSGRASRQKTLG